MSVKTNHTCDYLPLSTSAEKGIACLPGTASLTRHNPTSWGFPAQDSHPTASATSKEPHEGWQWIWLTEGDREIQQLLSSEEVGIRDLSPSWFLGRGQLSREKNKMPQVSLLYSLAFWISVKSLSVVFRNKNKPGKAQAPLSNLKGNVIPTMCRFHQCSSWPWKP